MVHSRLAYWENHNVLVAPATYTSFIENKYSEPAVACIQCNDGLQTIYMDCTISIEHVTAVYSFYVSLFEKYFGSIAPSPS